MVFVAIMVVRAGARRRLLARNAAAALSAALFAGLLIMRMLFELAQKPAGLKLLIEPLQRGVDRLIGLNENVNQR